MTKIAGFLVVFFLFVGIAQAQTVLITGAQGGHGNGALLWNDPILIGTVQHNLSALPYGTVTLSNGQRLNYGPQHVVFSDPKLDLAMLAFRANTDLKPYPLHPVGLSVGNYCKLVHFHGSAEGKEMAPTWPDGSPRVYCDVPAQKGMSGAPILTQKGRVKGFLTHGARNGAGSFFTSHAPLIEVFERYTGQRVVIE